MVSLLNGFSQMGSAISSFAGTAAVAQQKSDLEKQQMELANQLREGSDTRLALIQGDQARQTAVTAAGAQGDAAIKTATAENALPMTAAQKDASNIQHGTLAETVRHNTFDEGKPVPGGFYSPPVVYDKETKSWKSLDGSDGGAKAPDPQNPNLGAQIGLPEGAIGVADGRITGRAAMMYRPALEGWAAKTGINVDTLIESAKGAKQILKVNTERNAQGNNLERELTGTIANVSDLAQDVDLSSLKFVNKAAVWTGIQKNDEQSIKLADQLGRMRDELAGFNAVASGHLTQGGYPDPSPSDFEEAGQVLSNGISKQGLKAFGESISMTAAKNREVLQQAEDDANQKYYSLFGGHYFTPAELAAKKSGGAAPPAANAAASTTAPPPDNTPKLPPGVPTGSQYSASRKQWRDPTGKMYNADGSEAK